MIKHLLISVLGKGTETEMSIWNPHDGLRRIAQRYYHLMRFTYQTADLEIVETVFHDDEVFSRRFHHYRVVEGRVVSELTTTERR